MILRFSKGVVAPRLRPVRAVRRFADTLLPGHTISCLRTIYKFASAQVANSRFAFFAIPR